MKIVPSLVVNLNGIPVTNRTSIHLTTMSNVPEPVDPRERVISITVAVVSLVLGVLPLSGIAVAVVRRSVHHQPGVPPGLFLVSVLAVGFIGLSVTILRALRRGEVFHWMRRGPLNYLLVLLLIVLGAIMQAEATAVEQIMVRRGVPSRVADLLTLLPIIAGGIVFAVHWRRALAARVGQ